jgi:hypothetical protein
MTKRAETETIYVALKDEGTSVWRPVSAERVSNAEFRILGIVPSDEEREFQLGQVVVCEQKTLAGGVQLVAVGLLPNNALKTDSPKVGVPVS